jgi:hypothetical protein
MVANENLRLFRALGYGAWIRTKEVPYRAVTWVEEARPDGTRKYQGARWREVVPAGFKDEPRMYFAKDVTTAGPSDLLEYAPHPQSPVCGYQMGRRPDRYCPRLRAKGVKFCARHEEEFQGENP